MIHHLANSLANHGHRIQILGPRGSSLPATLSCKYKLIVDQHSAIEKHPGILKKNEDRRIFSLLEEIRNNSQFDCVLLMHPFYYGNGCTIFCSKNSIPMISFFYGLELRSLITKNTSWKNKLSNILYGKNKYGISKVRNIIKKSTYVFAISNYTKKLVLTIYKKNPEKIFISGCGIDMQDFRREESISPIFSKKIRQIRREELGLTQKTTVGFLGRLVLSKNAEIIIKSLAHLPDIHLLIMGEGNDSARLKKISKDIGVESRITWMGSVTEERKWTVLRSLDVLILPSKELANGAAEGFGIALLEGSAAGAPVIAARSGGMTDVVSDKITGLLFETDNEMDLADKINNLVSDENLCIALVSNARSQIIARFNWDTIAKTVMKRITP